MVGLNKAIAAAASRGRALIGAATSTLQRTESFIRYVGTYPYPALSSFFAYLSKHVFQDGGTHDKL